MDMMKMFEKVKEMQAKLQEAQENLGHVTDTGESGGGMVKVVANGKRQLISLEIDAELCKPEDREMLQDLVVAAVNQALLKVEEKSKQEIKKSTEGLIPNIPGLNLGF